VDLDHGASLFRLAPAWGVHWPQLERAAERWLFQEMVAVPRPVALSGRHLRRELRAHESMPDGSHDLADCFNGGRRSCKKISRVDEGECNWLRIRGAYCAPAI